MKVRLYGPDTVEKAYSAAEDFIQAYKDDLHINILLNAGRKVRRAVENMEQFLMTTTREELSRKDRKKYLELAFDMSDLVREMLKNKAKERA